MVTVVNVHEAKTHLSRLLQEVAEGGEVVIARAGKPVADLVPHADKPLRFGTLKGRIRFDDAAFDEPDNDVSRLFDLP